jgi:integrase/recombinase XerD
MLQTAFYASLRASELCNLDDQDLDLKTLTIHIREGKGGRDGVALINNDCAKTLKHYLDIRPLLKIEGRTPLFYTDFGRRWDRRDVNRMFAYYKKKAGIEKVGGIHVFCRHSVATILVAKGCDIRLVKELLRHKDIRTTLRYAHVADRTLRERYNQCLTLGI